MNRVVAAVACFCAIAFSRPGGLRADEDAYPRPWLLIEADDLHPKLASGFVIVDARPRSAYAQQHAQNAVWVDQAEWAKAFGHGQDREGWSRRISALGIGNDSAVIVYDDALNRDAARIWWILRYWGVEDVRLLNGGWKAWKESRKLQIGPPDVRDLLPANAIVHTRVEFVAQPRARRLATKEQIVKSLGKGGVTASQSTRPASVQTLQIVDSRSEREFCGVDKMRNPRAGAIPGAKQLEWIDLIDQQTHRFKSAAELRRIFGSAGISFDRPTATYCQSGGRASVLAFAMELMGDGKVSNYYPSWAEWSSAPETPVVLGKPRTSK